MSTGVLRVAVIGSGGRLGSVVSRAVVAADDLELVAELGRDTPRAVLAQSGAEVALEVTGPASVRANVEACLGGGLSVVVGASGLDGRDLADLRTRLADTPDLGVLVVPNFSVGAVLAEALAVRAAAHLGSVEIIELHHDQKVDAPSGTARRTAVRIAAARAAAGFGAIPDATARDPDRARGAELDGIHVHAIRLPGLVAHQEVLFGGTGETVSIRHDSTSRESFVSGALLALRQVRSLPGLTLGLESLLGLADAP